MESNGTVRLYHPSGAMVTFLIPPAPQDAMQWIADYLASGFLPREPEVIEGEKVDLIGWVCRRSRISEVDGKEVPILDCYVDHPAMTLKFITVYLNTAKQVQEFETLSGAVLDRIPLWIGDKAPERGKDVKTDKFVYRLPHPIGVIHKPNPKYDPDETDVAKKKPKRLFVGWQAVADQAPDADPDSPESANGRPDDEQRGKDIMPADVQIIMVKEIKFTIGEKKKYMHLLAEDGKSYRIPTTKAFADKGYDVKQWVEDGGRMFDPSLVVYVEPLGKGDWQVARIGELEF